MCNLPQSANYPRIKRVQSFSELVQTPWTSGFNALCWERTLSGDFAEVTQQLGSTPGPVAITADRLRALTLSPSGQRAVANVLADLQLLCEHGAAPVLNCFCGYPCDDAPIGFATDVYSYHADSAPLETDTFLCTYHGAPSEGLRNDEAQRRVEIPETRAELLKLFGGPDNMAFAEFLADNCYDLHYVPRADAQPFSFGVGNMWRIATAWPGCPVPPCLHRAPPPATPPAPRLLLIC